MNGRDRIKLALNHKEADRIPVDFGGCAQTTIQVGVIAKLREHFGLESSAHADFDNSLYCFAILDNKKVPIVLSSEKAAYGDLKNVVCFTKDNLCLNTEVVAEKRFIFLQDGYNVYSFFFDTKG